MSESLPYIPSGTVLAGRYEVRRELGRGGMGVVYLCRDTYSGESVALKRLFRADAKTDPEDVWWFQQEARCLASLDHPSIVRARDFGILADSTPFLAMDVAPGRSLLSWLEIGAVPWPWPYTVLWSVLDQILAGLAHAHARGVIHGDLKPTNLDARFPRSGDACRGCSSSTWGSRPWCAIPSIIGSTGTKAPHRWCALGPARRAGCRPSKSAGPRRTMVPRPISTRWGASTTTCSRGASRSRARSKKFSTDTATSRSPILHRSEQRTPRGGGCSCGRSWPSAPGSASSTPATRAGNGRG